MANLNVAAAVLAAANVVQQRVLVEPTVKNAMLALVRQYSL